MKKIILSLAISTFAICSTVAQKEIKYEKIFYKNLTIENNDVVILVDDAVSTGGETKLKLKIVNKSSDVLIYKPEESKFIINGTEMKPSEKWMILSPNESAFRIINLKGAKYNSVKSYSFVVDGLYKVALNSKSIATPDFKLPVSKNDFKTGDFDVSLNKLVKESDVTNLKLNVTYNGNKMGLVFPDKASVIMPNGKEYAVVRSKFRSGPEVLKKGQTEAVTLKWERMAGGSEMDMQKVDMNVKFNDMFSESTPEKLKSETIPMEFDEEASNAKGR